MRTASIMLLSDLSEVLVLIFLCNRDTNSLLIFYSGMNSISVPVFGGIRSANTDSTFRQVIRLAKIKYQ